MPDNGQSRSIEGRSVSLRDAGLSRLAWQGNRISQADTFHDLALAIAGSLAVALLANLLVVFF
jgi:hypothetical protein